MSGDTLRRGAVLIELGRPAEAVGLADVALVRHPDDPSLHRLRAQALLQMDRPAEAERSARSALALDPADRQAAVLIIRALLHLGQADRARRAAERTLAQDPEDPYVLYLLVVAQLNAHRLQDADHTSRLLLQTWGHLDVAMEARALVAVRTDRPDLAAAYYRRSLAREPHDTRLMLAASDAALLQGKRQEAVDLRVAAVRSEPTDARNRSALTRPAVTGGLVLGLPYLVLQLVRVLVVGQQDEEHSPVLLTLVLVVAVLVGIRTARRLQWKRSLPPDIWRGLARERKLGDAALLALLGLSAATVGTAVAVSRQGPLLPAALSVLAGAAALAVAGRFDPAWSHTRHQVRAAAVAGLRAAGSRSFRRRQQSRVDPVDWVITARQPRTFDRALSVFKVVTAALVGLLPLSASTGGPHGLPLFLLGSVPVAALTGLVLDGRWKITAADRRVLVDVATRRPARPLRRAARSVLRLLLIPVLLLEGLACAAVPHRMLHDRLTGTVVAVPEPRELADLAAA